MAYSSCLGPYCAPVRAESLEQLAESLLRDEQFLSLLWSGKEFPSSLGRAWTGLMGWADGLKCFQAQNSDSYTGSWAPSSHHTLTRRLAHSSRCAHEDEAAA